MKICQVISDSNIGGAGVLVERICKALCDEFEFLVVVPKGAKLKGLFESEEVSGCRAGVHSRRHAERSEASSLHFAKGETSLCPSGKTSLAQQTSLQASLATSL